MISVLRMTDEVKKGLKSRDRRILRLILENEGLRKRVESQKAELKKRQLAIDALRGALRQPRRPRQLEIEVRMDKVQVAP